MMLFKGLPAGFNFTSGPAMHYEGPRTIDKIYKLGEPVILLADMIPMDELRKIELTRIRGFIFSEGDPVADEDLYNFLFTEKRAAVLSCKDALDYICEGDLVIVDGIDGLVCLDPNEETLRAFQEQRAKGAPDDKGAQLQRFAQAILHGLKAEREDAIARGEKVRSGPVPKEEALAIAKQQPGLIYQILAGLPLPNSPTAGHAHDHPELSHMAGQLEAEGHAHDHAHDDDAEEKKPDARSRREARDRERRASRGEPEPEAKSAAGAEAKPEPKADSGRERRGRSEPAPAPPPAPEGEPPAAGAEDDGLGFQT
jgi:hypothetical protein